MSDNIEVTYPLVRCAAFNQASLEWAGSNRLGSYTVEIADQAIKTLVSVAVLIRMERSDGTVDAETQIALRDTRNIADLYLERFEATYARVGQAWEGDPVWVSDLETCAALVATLQAEGR